MSFAVRLNPSLPDGNKKDRLPRVVEFLPVDDHDLVDRLLHLGQHVAEDKHRLSLGSKVARFGGPLAHKIEHFALTRLSLFVAKRHRAPARSGRKLVAYESPNRMGLITLNGRVNRPTTQQAVAGRAECRQ
jgi:hypothetical protein